MAHHTVERGLLHMEPEREYRNFEGIDRPDLPTDATFHDVLEKNLQWSDLDWLRGITTLPLVVKGIQTADDALLCAERGVDAIVVSNHGGHTVNGLKASIETLPEVCDAVRGQLEVYMDGGVRKGTDVLKAMALGAKAVFIGRPAFWGLTVGGEDGLVNVLQILENEVYVETGRCGVREIADIRRSMVEWEWNGSASPRRTES
jgi:isopentenyl diphosphate isomerase/L-lactate dehydrogenase-like FMN-dependent dehydrogenase